MPYNHPIPAVLNPPDDLCVKVIIPAHPDYVALFIRAVRQLENDRHYQRDYVAGDDVKIVRAQWRDRTITPMIEELMNTTGFCQDLSGDCLFYAMFADFITFTPQNPYTQPDLIPEDYLQPPFFLNGKDNSHNLPQYNQGDVLLDIGSVSLELGFDLANAPTIDLCLEHEGTLELHLLSIPLGGVAVVTVDYQPNILDILAGIITGDLLIVDLNQDNLSLPPETAKVIIQEIEITEDIEHHVYITFLPVIDDSFIPIRFGGGIRKIELCGNLTPCGEERLIMTTVAEICEGVICALEKSAERFLTGVAGGGFTVNPDGSISEGGGAPDDPLTPENESAMSIAGAGIRVRMGINALLADITLLYGADATEDTILADAQYLISSEYKVDLTAMDAALAAYWAARALSETQIAVLNADTLDSRLYCGGISKQTINQVIIEFLTVTVNAKQICSNIVNALTDEQIEDWSAQGAKLPTSHYLVYSCVPIETETILIPFGAGISTVFSWKENHRMKITVSGNMVDTVNVGRSRDFWWQTEADGSHTFVGGALVAWSQGAFPPAEPSSTEVPYRASHIYVFTLDTGSAGPFIPVTGKGSVDSSINGNFTMLIEDLGEIT